MAIELISKIKPKNNGDFPLVDAEDIAYKDGRLPEFLPRVMTQAQYDAEKDTISENTPILIIEG